ncbi:hypothetical protein LCGC14_1147850 [marine sediment metagenome]|uniref:Uncharacterized protein n=1 Tax=marine sediment metagenome TaxID=412755 RepID=A0A0F9M1D0_9ZZZZ
MCDCINRIEKAIKNSEGAALAKFEHFGSQKSEVSYKPYTQAGNVFKHWRYTSVPWNFCPFCGEAMK